VRRALRAIPTLDLLQRQESRRQEA
jgi:hypothetical protein